MKYLRFFLMLLYSIGMQSQSPVNKNATPEAKALLAYIYSLEDKIISGQHTYNHQPTEFYDLARSISGKNPAIWGSDFYWSAKEDPGKRVVETAKKMHNNGAIITLMWHVGKPTDDPPFRWKTSTQGELSDAEWQELITPGTNLFKRWEKQVDHVAGYLKELQKANIPILWRPYHEMNGVWFWWGDKKGGKGYAQLWKNLYERLVNHHKLNNLLWVWNANGPRDIPNDQAYDYHHYYPGHEYVDILATDVYHFDYEQKDYQQLLNLANGKPIALGEVGELPKPDILEAQPKWSWFMVWSNWIEKANTKERVQEVYNRAETISRDDLPALFD
ncbi:glycosyl hydrolase [Galbibacter mesophilus]|uniref:glycosyl hydrolase n=1 Tax=Galbibacter mesophilus TaxID=379069 RepID=UPI00191E677A|nr:glycosyl hydrolase [Galbibacter mesophilus]MCM5662380.1 glycoside hydrolase family 26 protein [Galbibacter mesophilus]